MFRSIYLLKLNMKFRIVVTLLFLIFLSSKGTLQPAITFYHDKTPAWSTDGEWIVFESNRNGNSDIYKVRPEGTDLQQITTNPSRDIHPSWSPDGSTIVFQSNRTGNWDLWTIKSDGSTLFRLTSDSGVDAFAAWSPNGEYIVFNSNRVGDVELYLIKTDGSELKRITDSEGFDAMAKWHPNSKDIFFVSARTGSRNIFRFSLQNEEIEQIILPGQMALLPAISPEGTRMTYVERNREDAKLMLYYFETEATTHFSDVKRPSTCNWGPNGTIIFETQTEEGYRIFIRSIDESSTRSLMKE